MGESLHYLSGDLDEIEAVLSGEDRTVEAAIDVLLHDVQDVHARHLLRRLRQSGTLDWDDGATRQASWETFSELSSFFAGAFRLFGRSVCFDAWPDGLRLQFALADWHPLPRRFGLRVACRPIAPVRFTALGADEPAARWMPYLETWPHGFLRLPELDEVIEPLHRLIGTLWQALAESGEPGPLDDVAPGEPFPAARLIELMTLDDGSLEGWQIGRAAALYRAACRARTMKRDLLCVGY